MAQLLMTVNPKKRKRAGKKRRRKGGKRRKMSALQKLYFGGGGRKTSGGGKKRRRKRRRKSAALASSPVARRVSRRLRRRSRRSRGGRAMRLNFGSFIQDNLIPAGIGAGGALALDAALSFASPYLPAALNTGIARTGVKLAGAIGIGMVAGMIGGRRLGEQVMTGALIVTAYDFIKPFAAGVVPGISAYDMGWISPAPQIGVYAGDDNAYSGMMGGMGVYAGDDFNYYG